MAGEVARDEPLLAVTITAVMITAVTISAVTITTLRRAAYRVQR